jgi:hypothetical protein
MSSKIDYISLLIILIPLLLGYLIGTIFLRTVIPGILGFILTGVIALIGAVI